jgi:hypothetical protein
MREHLARLRAQIQMERDRLEGRGPERPGQPGEAVAILGRRCPPPLSRTIRQVRI